MENNIVVSPAELPIVNGAVYHLALKPGELAKDILIMGDPERVSFIADEFFETREVDRLHRGMRSITGRVRETGQRVSLITSGMGAPSIEIVLNEIIALNEIDFPTRTRKISCDMINIVRVGTSGSVRKGATLGTLVVTAYATGLDNTGSFYGVTSDHESRLLENRIRVAVDNAIPPGGRLKGKVFPYAAKAHPDVVRGLERAAGRFGIKYTKGVTVSTPGFFGCQGRAVARIPVMVPDIDRVLASVDTGMPGLQIENVEMEAGFLLYFMGALGYRAGEICAVVDVRREDRFVAEHSRYIHDAARAALMALHALQ
jgi:uridine phosphorylase